MVASRLSYLTSLILLLIAGGMALYFRVQDSAGNPVGTELTRLTGETHAPLELESKKEVPGTKELPSATETLAQPDQESATGKRAGSPSIGKDDEEIDQTALFPISGRVIDELARGVPGIEVAVYPKNLFTPSDPKAPVQNTNLRVVRTDIDGFYGVWDIPDGEYRLRTERDERYDAAELIVRAGTDSADLILRARQLALVVDGTVSGDGEPLPGVEVIAVGQPSGAAYTDKDGSYEIELEISAGKPAYTLRFARDGYREQRKVLTADDLAARGRIRVDTDLEPRQTMVEVTGWVRDREGETISGETVQLYSEAARQRYTAVSGRRGEIHFPSVETSDDYMVSARPADVYQDYVALDVDIGVAGAELDIVLEPRAHGRLVGQMVNPDGRPVPSFSLWLRNREALNRPPRLVTGDPQGFFEIDRVEAGPLVFETRGSPHVTISGIRLAPGETRDVILVLDWGTHRVSGLVMDDMGRPVSASELFVTSVRDDGGLRSHVVRRAVTDETGFFLVSQVGSGYHTIRVDSPGFRSRVIDHEVGRESPGVIIRLERAYPHGM